jgi:hypothetical protein
LREDGDYKVWELDNLMSTFFAIFYVDNMYLASRDAEFLQCALDILVSLFERVGLETNTSKMQTMIAPQVRFGPSSQPNRTSIYDEDVSPLPSGMGGMLSAPGAGKH